MTYSNGEIRELDLKSYLRGPIFKPLRRDMQLFRRVFVDAETETLTWDNGADMDPQTLYEDSIPVTPRPAQDEKRADALAPKLRHAKLVRVHSVKPLHDFWVHVTFTNGVARDIDLKEELWGPVFEPLRNDPALFQQVFVDPITHTLAWPGELDLDPDTLYYGDTPPWATPASRTKTTKRAATKTISNTPAKRKTRTVKSSPGKRPANARTTTKRASTRAK